VYDDVKPPRRARILEQEPFLGRPTAGYSMRGIADCLHDLAQVASELGTPRLDVAPSFFSEEDTAPIGIERPSDHVATLDDKADGA